MFYGVFKGEALRKECYVFIILKVKVLRVLFVKTVCPSTTLGLYRDFFRAFIADLAKSWPPFTLMIFGFFTKPDSSIENSMVTYPSLFLRALLTG
tara:strand:- start:342 stop:626 length:285 start_codon:yes stop_codon:yes gene_type:complete